ncbi:LINE-type retrotransposon LIb DNA [Gossypium australe]|uniref:LINE-type retrotransposon LIb DNA n=1 Tax=Gossypium australe TaxID=47621 RepID=A0A5B6X1G2_9ROSI|nr:LINE-type retrotransposon LIb DNA [Gossypium australe]
MEWLAHLINSEINTGKWQPIKLSRSGPALSHLFFADDLVIFCKAEMDQARLVKETLKHFCDLSGHKINARKSNIFFSKSVDTSLSDQISQLYGFQKVLNLRNYLGVPLLHDRVTKSTLNFVIEKVRSKLQKWEARKLSLAGRITLAQSVLLTIPSYFMQSLAIPKGVCDELEKIARQFIWGGTAGNPKIALLGWDSICQPRTCGGLGLRHLQDHNNSFLMKIGFNLVTRKDALWVQVLRSKYGWKDQLPESILKSQSSHLWKSLSKVWPLLRENLMWSVGDGSTISGWKDNWIPGIGPLLSYAPAQNRINLDSTLKDWILPNGSWNVDMLRLWLPEDKLKRIVSIPPPHPDNGEDRIIWARSGSGSFSIRSAYWTLKENSWKPKDDNWKVVWNYQGPQRVRIFLWLVANQRLLTNSERSRRGITHSKACPSCGHDPEDTIHVLRDCWMAKETWKLVVPLEEQPRIKREFGKIEIFIFQNIDGSPLESLKHHSAGHKTLSHYHKTKGLESRGTNNICSDKWVHLSSDGAVARIFGDAAAGGVVRDQDGNWILGYTHYLGSCSPLEAELWGVLDGVLILLNKGYKKVKIQTDNLEVIRALATKDMIDSGTTLLRRIKRIMYSEGQWEIKHVPREGNLTADQLAKIGLSWQTSLRVFEVPPDVVITAFLQDKEHNVS